MLKASGHRLRESPPDFAGSRVWGLERLRTQGKHISKMLKVFFFSQGSFLSARVFGLRNPLSGRATWQHVERFRV